MNQENIKNINTKITNFILNIDCKYIKRFLNIDYCDKELIILKNKINTELNENEIISFNKYIKNVDSSNNISNNISNYYIKLIHIFATVFNITSTNINIVNNTLIIPFDISNCIPDIKYIYETKYDYNTEKFVLDKNDERYIEDLKQFCSFFMDKHNVKHYADININNVNKKNINSKKKIFESYFNNYTYFLTLLVQHIKKIHFSLLKIINNYFVFKKDNDIYYIDNIVSDNDLDKIISEIREDIIEYFFTIDDIYNNTNKYFKLTIFEKFSDTIVYRIKLFK